MFQLPEMVSSCYEFVKRKATTKQEKLISSTNQDQDLVNDNSIYPIKECAKKDRITQLEMKMSRMENILFGLNAKRRLIFPGVPSFTLILLHV